MIRQDVKTLPIGSKLAKSIFSSSGQLLLRQGTFVAPSIIERLLQRGITEVFLTDSESNGSDKIQASNPANTIRNQQLNMAFQYAQKVFHDFTERIKTGVKPDVDDVERAVGCLCDEVVATNNVLEQLCQLREIDNYTLQHSVAVSLLSMKIGHLLKVPDDRLRKLGMSGLLHDIGKEMVPPKILNKSGPLTKAEWEIMSQHPLYGQSILQKIEFTDEFVELVVLQHHERIDGSGYPFHNEAATVHNFSRIVAVADVFDAMTTDRVYRPRTNPFMAADELIKQTFGPLDPGITNVFLNYLINLSHGKRIRLNTGEIGEVVMIERNEPNRPIVKIGKALIDLRVNRNLFIEEIV